MILLEYLYRNGITYRAFAERLGITPHHLIKITHGHSSTSIKNALRIEDLTQGQVTWREAKWPEQFNLKQFKDWKNEQENTIATQ